ncbi:hypothetical protein L0664_12955 [Octadecabacter sp. G9-8]|uniref:Uncharacterized protein n=1 Tax=Octadecabacter dasysiphoniae TaxID=2909341 RepID=A0ABS9D048_9RHOB|nr:hypothetical protein [Octadecabacter dasysiphoniae]MCF2871980.1 hypothetical protein [Octadecabacter dasysiphoniae]
MQHRLVSTLFAVAFSSSTIAQEASSTVVWGMSFQSGYSSGEVSITDFDDVYVIYFDGGIGRACKAVLGEQSDGSFAPIITNENVRGCDRLSRVVFRAQDGDTLPIEITSRDETQVYPLGLRNKVQSAGAIPDGLDIQGASLGISMSDSQTLFTGLAEMTENVAIVGRNPQSISYSYQQNDGSNIYMALSESVISDEDGTISQAEMSAMPVAALARFWNPSAEERPNLDTMRGALFDKFGTPSIQVEEERYSIYEWQYDLEANLLTDANALACSVSDQRASRVSYSSEIPTGFTNRTRQPYTLLLTGASSCGVAIRIRLDLIEGYTVARMEQTLWRHDSLLRDQLLAATDEAARIIAATEDSAEQETNAPDL